MQRSGRVSIEDDEVHNQDWGWGGEKMRKCRWKMETRAGVTVRERGGAEEVGRRIGGK